MDGESSLDPAELATAMRAAMTPFTAEEWEAARAPEFGYRRGYRDGYGQAIDDMLDLLRGGKRAKFPRPKEAHNLLCRFYDEKLSDWTYDLDRLAIAPPRFVCETSWAEVRAEAIQRDGGKCVWCGSQESLECDHITPVSRGGLPVLGNLRTLCKDCHANRSDGVYIREKNFLACLEGDAIPIDEWHPKELRP